MSNSFITPEWTLTTGPASRCCAHCGLRMPSTENSSLCMSCWMGAMKQFAMRHSLLVAEAEAELVPEPAGRAILIGGKL